MKRLKRKPQRRCVGCFQSKDKDDLIRISYYNGELLFDPEKKKDGRGIYVCRNKDCIKNAVSRKGIGRSLKMNIQDDKVNKIFDEILRQEVLNG